MLGLGGGFLLAVLPFNSVERAAIAPRASRAPRELPIQEWRPPSIGTAREADAGSVSAFAMALAPAQISPSGAADFVPDQTETSASASIAALSNDERQREPAQFDTPTSIPGGEYLEAKIPSSSGGSVGTYEALEVAAVPEPSTWILFACAVGLVFGRALRLRARR